MISPVDWKPSAEKLRQFGWFALPGFSLMATMAWWHGAPMAVYVSLGALAIFSPLLGLLAPNTLRPIYWALSAVGLVMGTIVGTLLMGALYFLVFTPIAYFFRLTKRDRLELRSNPAAETYWHERPAPRPPEDYFRQF